MSTNDIFYQDLKSYATTENCLENEVWKLLIAGCNVYYMSSSLCEESSKSLGSFDIFL